MPSRDTKPLHQHESFRIVVLRVIESFVYKSLDETISLLKITTVMNTNPLIQLVRTQISPGKTVETLPNVTIRDVILSITKIFQSSDIQILANNDNFKIKLTREAFQGLIDKHYGRYQENVIDSIKDDEEDYVKFIKEIEMIEKGELDQLVVQEFKETLQLQMNANDTNIKNNTMPIQRTSPPMPQQNTSLSPQLKESNNGLAEKTKLIKTEVDFNKDDAKPNLPQAIPNQSQQISQSAQTSGPIQPSQQGYHTQSTAPIQPAKATQQGHQAPPSIPSSSSNTISGEFSVHEFPQTTEKEEEPQSDVPVESKAPTPEATTSTHIEQGSPEDDASESDKVNEGKKELERADEGKEKEEVTGEQEKDKTDEKESSEEGAEENKDDGDIKEQDLESDENVQPRASDKKRPMPKGDDMSETPAKKKTKFSASSVPSSPAGPVHAPPNKKLQILSNPLIANITSYKYASTFLQPVSENNAPDYYSLIKEPRDLKTIKAMVKDGRIQNAAELERDILLMFANAIMYNKTDSDIYNWSKEMQVETDKLLQLFKESYDTT